MDIEEAKAKTRLVTLVRMITKDNKPFTIELYSETAEQAYLKERTIDSIVEKQANVERGEIIGTYRRVDLKVVGEES